jgi:hypothetical protein
MLTLTQLATLKAAILADVTANAFPNTNDGNFALAAYLNSASDPVVNVWRKNIQPTEISSTITMSAFVALTAIKQNGLLLLTQGLLDATSANVRAAFNEIFGAGPTLTALTALAQRIGTRFEIIFSSAAGVANISTMFGQSVTYLDVGEARNS